MDSQFLGNSRLIEVLALVKYLCKTSSGVELSASAHLKVHENVPHRNIRPSLIFFHNPPQSWSMFSAVKSSAIGLIDRLQSEKVSVKESFVITGFWRSGTTWLQKVIARVVQGKTVFEPLHCKVAGYPDLADAYLCPAATDRIYLNSYMPYCTNFDKCEALWEFVEATMKGRVYAYWLQRGRSIKLTSPTCAVVKFVRGQLMQPAFQKGVYPVLIHVRRDPRAVIASLLRKNWGWWMQDISLKDQLLRPTDGRTDYFNRWTREIEKADKADFLTRAATYWALTERFVEDRGLPQSGGTSVCYEKICLQREKYLNRTLADILPNSKRFGSRHLHGDSPTTQNGRESTTEARVYGWENELSPEQIEQVESIAHRFNLQYSLVDRVKK